MPRLEWKSAKGISTELWNFGKKWEKIKFRLILFLRFDGQIGIPNSISVTRLKRKVPNTTVFNLDPRSHMFLELFDLSLLPTEGRKGKTHSIHEVDTHERRGMHLHTNGVVLSGGDLRGQSLFDLLFHGYFLVPPLVSPHPLNVFRTCGTLSLHHVDSNTKCPFVCSPQLLICTTRSTMVSKRWFEASLLHPKNQSLSYKSITMHYRMGQGKFRMTRISWRNRSIVCLLPSLLSLLPPLRFSSFPTHSRWLTMQFSRQFAWDTPGTN